MRHFIIDGNNLIGKIPPLFRLQKKDGQLSREKLAYILESYFINKRNIKVSLHFDGFMNQVIRVSTIKIIYSGKRTADDEIKHEIENEKNRRNLIIITSDNNILQFARVCGCEVKTSEEFSREIMSRSSEDEEKKREGGINNDEIKRLFDV
jgi:predicted RNA-binding protein with PIN domain